MSFTISQTIIVFALITGQILSNDLPNSINVYKMDYTGEVICKKDTLLIIEYGNGKTKLPYFGENTLFHPYVFDIDKDLNIYLLYHNLFYKFSSKTGDLIWGKQLSDNVLDFKYYNRKIFVYEIDNLTVLNSFYGNWTEKISLKELNVNTLGVQNLSFFYNHYLFLQDFNFSDFRKIIKYIYDLESDSLSNKIENPDSFTIIPKRSFYDHNFINDLFDPVKKIFYEGQSNKYVFFTYMCDPAINRKECPDGSIKQYYIFNKEKNSFKKINENFDWGGTHYGVDTFQLRPFATVNDTSFVYSVIIRKPFSAPEKLIYFKLTFEGW